MIMKSFTVCAARVVAFSCLVLAIALASSCSVSADTAFDAAWNGDAVTVARYLSSGGDADAVDGAKNTLAHAAAYNRQSAVLRVLVAAKAPLSMPNGTGFLPVHIAASNNDVESLRALLDAGADINAENGIDRRKGPIHYAAMAGALDAAALLLEKGVDVNALCGLRATPVTWAADRSSLETVKFFVAHGADLTIRDLNGDTALASARATRKDDIVQYLHSIGVTQ